MEIENSPTRTQNNVELTELSMDDAASEIQRGIYPKSSFYGDASNTSSHKAFTSAINMAANYASFASSLRDSLKSTRTDDETYHLTDYEFSELEKKAVSISSYSNIPADVVEDFLLILCYVNKLDDMKVIADAIQIPELYSESIMRKPLEILAIGGLEKIAFAASALEGLINMFRKYLTSEANPNKNSGEDIGDILNTLSSIVSGFSGGSTVRLENGGAEDAIGNFLSELILGKRVPMNVIAKNPNLQAPSYVGKAFFGESPVALSNVDVDQLFNKKIAAFPIPSNGAGTSSFGIQNMGSISNGININQLVSKMVFGTTSFTEGTKKARQIESIVNDINSITGALGTDSVDIRRADTALPLMSALSASMSKTPQCVFSIDTFRNGWMLSNSVTNHIQLTDKSFLEAVKRFL